MPYTSDGKYFPYTADGILASKRHQMNLDAEKRTMGKQRPQPDQPFPPGMKPRHLDPNHPMNRVLKVLYLLVSKKALVR